MPRQSQRTDVIMGAGGVPGSLNGVLYPFSTYGRGAFIDDYTVVVARAPDALVCRWPIHSLQCTPIEFPPDTNGSRYRLANFAAGGGGQYILTGEVPDGTKASRLFGSIPELRYAGAGDVAFDGTIAFKSIYQSYDGITIIPPGAARPETVVWPPTPAHPLPPGWIDVPNALSPYDLQALPGGIATWRGGAYGRPRLRPYWADAMNTQSCMTQEGTDWILYWSNAVPGLVLQVDGESEGYILEQEGKGFAHHMVATGNDVTIAWSYTQGEGPGDIVKLVANRTSVKFLIDVYAHRPIPQWQSFIKPIVVPPITRPVWLAWFQFTSTPIPPSNALLAVRNVQTSTVPVIVSSESEGLPGPYVGYFVSGGSVDEVEQHARAVNQRGFVAYAYWDQRRWPRWPLLPPGSVLCLQTYCRAGESPEQLETDMRSILLTAPAYQIALVCQSYTSNTSLTADLAPLIPVFARLANEFRNVIALLPFSGYGRATGYVDHPETHEYWRSLSMSIPGVPALPPQPGPPKPEPIPPPVTPYPAARAYRVRHV